MTHINRVLALVLVIMLVCTAGLTACAPANEAVLASTPEPTLAVTAAPTATPIPTPEPSPTPRVIEFSIERSLAESTIGAEIIFHHLTYTKNQGMVLTFTVSNHTDKYINLISPIYANINGYGVLFTTEDKYDTWIGSISNSQTEVSLSAKLDETMDSLMNIEQIESARFECVFVLKGESFREISEEFINADCPFDYVQSYCMHGEKASLSINPEYYNTGISNDIQISSIYSDAQKKIYLTLAGTTLDENSALGEVADFGHAFLAIDGVTNPYDDDVYLPNGEEIYLPNNGYCVVSFDVSRVPGFNYQKNRLYCSFEMTYSQDCNPFSYFSAILRAESKADNNDFSVYSNQGEIWIDENDFQFIYKGLGKDEDLNFYFDGNLINKTQSETIANYVDVSVNGMRILFVSDPVPPGCVLQMHSIQSFPFNTGGDIEVTVEILGVGGRILNKTTKTIQLADE